ncbi:MAG: hypothetical protein Kow0013_02030 [Pararhodobacter sp.]
MAPPLPHPSLALRLLTALLIALFATLVLFVATALPEVGAGGNLVDFDAFYITGQLALEGRADEAYDMAVMADVQRALVGHQGFMPWTYPPQFDLLTMALPALPRGLAYALLTGATLAFYLWVLARLAGPSLAFVLVAIAPPVYVCITIGQNAFLTGGLIGLYALLAQRARPGAAGWPLGLLVIKPHLGIGLGVHALASRNGRGLAIALGIALASSLLATLVFGPGIWGAFLSGVEQAGHALRTGFYPLFRMTSVYAALHTLGVPPGIAVWAQIGIGLLACVAIAVATARGQEPRHALALACFGTALVSPYLYDYDLAIAGVGIALVLPDLARRTSGIERLLLLALFWLAGAWGAIHALPLAGLPWEERAANARATQSFGACAYLLTLALGWRILRRPDTTPARAADHQGRA